jgi:hypothetical protein
MSNPLKDGVSGYHLALRQSLLPPTVPGRLRTERLTGEPF